MNTKQDLQPRWDQVARRWWATIQGKQEDVAPRRGRDRVALARLRRVATPVEALEEPAVSIFTRGSGSTAPISTVGFRVSLSWQPLAHIKEDAMPAESGFEAASPKCGARRTSAYERASFKRLLAAAEDNDLLTTFRRAVALAGGKISMSATWQRAFSTGPTVDECAGPSIITEPGLRHRRRARPLPPKTRTDCHGPFYSTPSSHILSRRRILTAMIPADRRRPSSAAQRGCVFLHND